MCRTFRMFLALFTFVTSVSAIAQTTWSITPASGPTSGGQEVHVKGNFGAWPYSLIFGSASVPATRVDDTTLRAFTPPHPSGTVDVTVFEYDMGISTGLTYTYTNDESAFFERVLLPILTPPVLGAHGSEFRTEFRAFHRNDNALMVYGLFSDCGEVPCFNGDDRGFYLAPSSEIGGGTNVWMSGTPGAFVWVPRAPENELSMHLRVYDVSREATNFGTEIPIVHEDEMRTEPLTLLGVPTDSRFRNTLRIYGTFGWSVDVTVEGPGYQATQQVDLSEPQSPFEPAYGVFTNFPTNVGPVRVTVVAPPPDILIYPLPPPPPFWAFVTVTNNDTQHITVISPQR